MTDDGSCAEGVCVCVSCTCLGGHGVPGMKIPQKSCHTAGIELLMLYFNADSETSDLTVHVLCSQLASSVFTQLVAICRPPPLFVHFGLSPSLQSTRQEKTTINQTSLSRPVNSCQSVSAATVKKSAAVQKKKKKENGTLI